ncbi:MAG: hypothetical protein FJ303_21010 [Planctomycetes bacterium]|nr:hypothetical protein [Planctomycetota bacterium]
MENLDKAILLGVLAGTGLFVFIVLRQLAKRWDEMHGVQTAPPAPKPEPPQEPVPVTVVAEPPPPVVTSKPSEAKPVLTPKRKAVPKAKRPTKQKVTPAKKVLAMLTDKDSLTRAFLLREILGPPVSQRGK